ncbi:MAG: RNA-binding cell elongation regulator Jag/EloR [Dehalococcoidia bacterium]|nr:RNA-binding cell elongation regulator Jag/EloR [Dehalococcoidia bacterium]
MESVDVSAKTVDEAIEKALAQLGLDRSEVEIEVVKEGRAGILGIGGEEARVIVRPKETAALEGEDVRVAVEVLEKLLSLLGIDATVQVRAPETPGDGVGLVKAVLDVSGEDLGILIGRRGDTLASLQYLVNLIVGRRLKTKTAFGIDVEGYRRRREQSLRKLALSMAERVKATGQTVTLEPMPPNERRIVHLALAKDSAIITESIGEGENRKVAIYPS